MDIGMEEVRKYLPQTKEEVMVKEKFLQQWEQKGAALLQRLPEGHITVSAMILNEARDKMLMVYHNIYQSFSWAGGHADGAENFLQKIVEEVEEETGVTELWPVCGQILSLDLLPVKTHQKKGQKVAAHCHYNVSFGFYASEKQTLRIKEDENSRVTWIPLTNWKSYCTEPHMFPVYEKLLQRIEWLEQEKVQRYALLATRMISWYCTHARDLPWRKDRDPYHIWLSEIMLQQTRVEAVKGYYQRFLEQLPTISALAAASEDVLLKLWEGLGYYSRVRNLQKAAQTIMDTYHGVFPTSYEQILALPGIGVYTAGAIASICFDAPTPAVDGNVVRVTARLTENFADGLADGTKRQITAQLAEVYPKGPQAYLFNQSLMELGATICMPNGEPHCLQCPMQDVCMAYQNNTWSFLPQKRKKKKRKIENKTVFLLRCQDTIAIEKRKETGLLARLWQFPNVDGHLTVQQALNQAAAWGVQPQSVEKEVTGKHIFSHVEWNMVCYYIRCAATVQSFFWKTERQMEEEVALPTAFRIFWEPLFSKMTEQ